MSDALVSQVDLAASLAALTGQKPDPVTMPDSVNVLPALLGESKTGRAWVVEHANRLALRDGDWKFITPGWVVDRLGPWTQVTATDPGFFSISPTTPAKPTTWQPVARRRSGNWESCWRISAIPPPQPKRTGGWMSLTPYWHG